MNEQDERFDELEAELSAMSPTRPSQKLRQRLALQLAEKTVPPQPLRWPLLSLTAAACIAVVVVLWQINAPIYEPARPLFSIEPLADAKPTSLAAYARAWNESPEALDAMLERDGQTVLPPSEPISLAKLD